MVCVASLASMCSLVQLLCYSLLEFAFLLAPLHLLCGNSPPRTQQTRAALVTFSTSPPSPAAGLRLGWSLAAVAGGLRAQAHRNPLSPAQEHVCRHRSCPAAPKALPGSRSPAVVTLLPYILHRCPLISLIAMQASWAAQSIPTSLRKYLFFFGKNILGERHTGVAPAQRGRQPLSPHVR